MGQFGVMIGQLVGFLIMLMVGYGCVRLRFYGQTALDGMCSLLLNVLIPVLVFSNAVDGVREHEHGDEHVEQQRAHAVQRRLTVESKPHTSIPNHQHDQKSDQLANHDAELPHAHSSRSRSPDFLSLVHIGSHLDRLGGTRISMFDTTTCQSTSRSTVPRANAPPATPCCRCCASTITRIAFR